MGVNINTHEKEGERNEKCTKKPGDFFGCFCAML
jgi:hypothetical protein